MFNRLNRKEITIILFIKCNSTTPKKYWIFSNICKSFLLREIEKIGVTDQPNLVSFFLRIDIINEDSASENPVIQNGLRLLAFGDM